MTEGEKAGTASGPHQMRPLQRQGEGPNTTTLDPLNSQTKCNTLLSCCHATLLYLTLDDRCEMARLHTTGHSSPKSNSGSDTVARELNRNGSTTQGYNCRPTSPGAPLAGLQARPRPAGATVLAQLLPSPTGGAAGAADRSETMRADDPQNRVHYLPQTKGRRCYKSPASFIGPGGGRGNWEADLMLFRNGQAILEATPAC